MKYEDTLEYKVKELNKALDNLFKELCKALKIQEIVDYLNNKINLY